MGVYLTNNIELTVQLGMDIDTGEKVCSYYFADRTERTLFWLHELDTKGLFGDVMGVNEPSHIREFMNHARMSRSILNLPTQGMQFNFSTGECHSFVSCFSRALTSTRDTNCGNL
jgi:hypothetical protein